MGASLNIGKKKKNWWENKNNHITLKDYSTKADTNSEEADDSNPVFSDLIFTFAAAPDEV